MSRRHNRDEETKWRNADVLRDVIPATLPDWPDTWLHAIREVIRREVGYKEGIAQVSEENFEEAKRMVAEWMRATPYLNLREVLTLIEREHARRRSGLPGSTGQ